MGYPKLIHKNLDNYDEIESILNISRSNDLDRVLRVTPKRLRIQTALAFCDLSKRDWFLKAGIINDADIQQPYIAKWLNKHTKIPLGIAFRLSKVMNVSCELLFEDYIDVDIIKHQ